MIKPDYRFEERELLGVFVLNGTANRGTLLTRDTSDTSVIGQGTDVPYGKVVAGSVSAASDRELGVLFYDVTTDGVTFFDQVTNTLRYDTAANTPCSIMRLKPNDIFSTDSFLTSGTGAITAGAGSGNTAADTLLGIKSGQYVIASSFGSGAGSIPRAKLIGNCVVDDVQCIRVQVL